MPEQGSQLKCPVCPRITLHGQNGFKDSIPAGITNMAEPFVKASGAGKKVDERDGHALGELAEKSAASKILFIQMSRMLLSY
jgi:hypothetical protein